MSTNPSTVRGWATRLKAEGFIRIPAKSRAFNPNWESDGILKRTLEDSAEWGRRLLPCAEFEIIEKPGIPPALFIRIPTAGATRASLHSSTAISTSSLKPKAGAKARPLDARRARRPPLRPRRR